jgi:hypothetical protein
METIEGMDPSTDWGSLLDAAQAEQSGQVGDVDVDDIFTRIVTQALNRAIQAAGNMYLEAKLDGRDVADSTAKGGMKSSRTALSDAKTDADIDSRYISDQIVDDAKKVVTASEESLAAMESAARTDEEGIIDSIEARTLSPSGLADLTGNGIRSSAVADSDSVIEATKAACKDFTVFIGDEIDSRGKLLSSSLMASGMAMAREGMSVGANDKASEDAVSVELAAREKGKTAMADVMSSIDPDVSSQMIAAVNFATDYGASTLSRASASAREAVEAAPIADLVKSYRQRALKGHLASVNRLSSGMADINAVNSSAFTIGMALQEVEFTRDVNDFQAKLEIQLYTTFVPAYLDTFKTTLGEYLKSYVDRCKMHMQVYSETLPIYANVFLSTLPQYISAYSLAFSEYLGMFKSTRGDEGRLAVAAAGMYEDNAKASSAVRQRLASDLARIRLDGYKDILGSHIDAARVFGGLDSSREAIFRDLLDNRVKLYASDAGREADATLRLFDTGMGEIGKTLSQHFDGALREGMTSRSERLRFVLSSLLLLSQMKGGKIEGEKVASQMFYDIEKASIIAKGEEFEKNLEYDDKSANWDLALFQRGGNVLSAVTGSVVSAPGGPSKTQSVLGGAASGASMGFMIGGPIGAGVGAVGGAIAGYQP